MSTNIERILSTIADLSGTPEGAYNIRVNGESIGRFSSENIEIKSKKDKPGIDIIVKPGTKNELVHIPVVVDASGLEDKVYNDFFIGEDCDVRIIAGCGIHNDGDHLSQHDGIHTFHVGKIPGWYMLKNTMVKERVPGKKSSIPRLL